MNGRKYVPSFPRKNQQIQSEYFCQLNCCPFFDSWNEILWTNNQTEADQREKSLIFEQFSTAYNWHIA